MKCKKKNNVPFRLTGNLIKTTFINIFTYVHIFNARIKVERGLAGTALQ